MIAGQPRHEILVPRTDDHARVETVLHGVMATQNQLIALVTALSDSFVEYLLDQDAQHQLGISD